MDGQEEFRKLDVYFSSIIYQVQTLAFNMDERILGGEVAFKQFINLPLANAPVQLPSILSINTNYALDLETKH